MSPHYHNQPSLFSHLPSSVKGALALQEGGQGQKPDISYPGGGPPQGPILGAVGGDLGSTLEWQWAWPGGLEVSAQGGLGIPLCWSWACCSQIPAPPLPCISSLPAAFPRLRVCVYWVLSPQRGVQGRERSSRGWPLSPCLEQLWPSSSSGGHHGPSCPR